MAGGRPTKYEPWMCERVIELGEMGKSLAQMCADLNIGRRTLFTWEQENEEFRQAMEIAREKSQNVWEQMANDHVILTKDGAKVDVALWSRSMGARFPEDYSRRNDDAPPPPATQESLDVVDAKLNALLSKAKAE